MGGHPWRDHHRDDPALCSDPSSATNICQASPSPCTTLVGVLAGANGIQAPNNVISFQPNQWFFVFGDSGSGAAGITVNSPMSCGTSNNGAIVGTPNLTSLPSLAPLFSGTLYRRDVLRGVQFGMTTRATRRW